MCKEKTSMKDKNNNLENAAIVISDDHYNALGMIRSLGENGIPVFLILMTHDKNTYVDKSKYVTQKYFVEKEETSILSKIDEISKGEFNYYIFPLSDFSANIIDKHCSWFKNNIVVPHANGSLSKFLDKSISKELAQSCGLHTAKSVCCNINDSDISWDSYPAIVKPLVSLEGAKSDIRIVNDKEELQTTLYDLSLKLYNRVLIEEYICGSDECMLEVMGCSTPSDVYYAGIIQKIREYPLKCGSTSFAKIVDNHDAISYENISLYLKKIGYSGLFDIELKYANGKAYFIECNFRNGAPGYAFTRVGKCIPLMWMCALNEEEYFDESSELGRECYFMCEQTDFLHVLKKNIKYTEWIKDYRKSNKIFVSKKDRRPSRKYFMIMLSVAAKKIFRKR